MRRSCDGGDGARWQGRRRRQGAITALVGAVCLMLAGCRSAPPPVLPRLPEALALPTHPVPAPNGYEALRKLAPLVDRRHEPPGSTKNGKQVPPTRAQELAATPTQLRDNRDALRLLREAAKQQWLYPYPPGATEMPTELHKARYLARLLTREAILLDQQGQSNAAADNLLTVLALSVKLPRGGGYVPRLHAWACRGMAFAQLRGLIARHRLTEAKLRLVAAQLGALDQQEVPLREAIAVEYHSTAAGVAAMPASQCIALFEKRYRVPWLLLLARWPALGKGIKDRLVADLLPPVMAWDAQIARLSSEPYRRVRNHLPPTPRESDAEALFLTRFPAHSLQREAQSRCYLRALRLMVRLELDYLAWEQYTRELDLVYGLSAAQRQDPFSGKDFRYRRVGRSYVLYSVGPDGEDNGGKGTHFFKDNGTDLVFWGERAEAKTSLRSKP